VCESTTGDGGGAVAGLGESACCVFALGGKTLFIFPFPSVCVYIYIYARRGRTTEKVYMNKSVYILRICI